MSINDFTNKIKRKLGIDTFLLMCLFVIIGVGISAFGLGQLSVQNNYYEDSDIIITNQNQEAGLNIKGSIIVSNIVKEKKYVASKNGKLYYIIGCSGAKRISPKNKIYFATSIDAEKSGYKFSTSCK